MGSRRIHQLGWIYKEWSGCMGGKKVICVSGYDLVLMLKNKISFRMLMEEKIRRAAETGNLYIKIDEIYPDIVK